MSQEFCYPTQRLRRENTRIWFCYPSFFLLFFAVHNLKTMRRVWITFYMLNECFTTQYVSFWFRGACKSRDSTLLLPNVNVHLILAYSIWPYFVVTMHLVLFHCRACVGLPPINHMMLEHKVPALMAQGLATPLPAHSTSHSKAFESHSIANGNGHTHVNGVIVNGF